jgi:hypothetical protein
LNKTKDWVLDYENGKPTHPMFFGSDEQEKVNTNKVISELNRTVRNMATAIERAGSPNPVGTRSFYSNITPEFENAEARMSEVEYRQARSHYLFMNYIFMDETLMPMRNLLSGHPNFLADIKGVPGLAAFLFPDHPQAREMADHFEKSVALNLQYHTRPDEPSWESRGGRWTENLGTYTWAFLRPTLKTTFLLHHFYDGKNRILQPNISLYANWLLNSLTSPMDIHDGKRVNPPQGAHSKSLPPSNLMYILGNELLYFDPLLAEHLFWMTTPDEQGFESGRADSWGGPIKSVLSQNMGTTPRLKSEKYTGYGINLRQNFGKPDEIYVHLQQIDEGPNYRWGRAGKGGSGIIYYYAEGKRYSHNGVEDVGDAPMGDTERCTNFGVKKNDDCYRCIGEFRSIGKNDLTDPLYDFGFAQYASIQSGSDAYPEYISRSVMMSDNDYIVVFDDVKDNTVDGRFSWTVGVEDDYPVINQLEPGVEWIDANIIPTESSYHNDKGVVTIKGRYYDGKGDFLTLVTHKENVKISNQGQGYKVNKPDGSTEWIFRDDQLISFNQGQLFFEGLAGIIHKTQEKEIYEAALFQGSRIGIPGLTASFEETPQYAGMSMKNTEHGFAGIIQSREEVVVTFELKSSGKSMDFYLDGQKYNLSKKGKNNYTATIKAGKYNWQWTNAGVIPGVPIVKSSFTGATWCDLVWSVVPGAESYLIQGSNNGGNEWHTISDNIKTTNYKITGLNEEKKIHIRILATAPGGTGESSGDYPVFPTNKIPQSPEGLRLVKTGNEINLNWGQVLGGDLYTLYRREKGSEIFEPVSTGVDKEVKLVINESIVYEFSVTSTNGNGESLKSVVVDTDESRIINWYPVPGEIFRRDTESQENGYVEYNHWIEQESPILKYPFQLKNN